MTTGKQLEEHREYLADERRIAAYRAALAEIVKPTDVVLDLGAGSGVLGHLACDAGAAAVIAVDGSDMLELARHIAADNAYGDRITHIRALSTDLDLDEKVDVVVCDQIGGLVHDAGILRFFADARKRLLARDGRLVPASFRIFFAPVTFDIGREAVNFWSSNPSSVDVSAARSFAANSEWPFNVTAENLVALSSPQELAEFPSDHDDPIVGSARFIVESQGRFDGFLGWFEANMSPSVTLTNDPWSLERCNRWCNFYAVDEAVEVLPRDCLSLMVDIRPKRGIVSWSIDVDHADGRTERQQHSTFLTQPEADLFAAARPVARTERAEVVSAIHRVDRRIAHPSRDRRRVQQSPLGSRCHHANQDRGVGAQSHEPGSFGGADPAERTHRSVILQPVVACAAGLQVAQRGARWDGEHPALHVEDVAPVPRPDAPPREARLLDGTVWRRHWPQARSFIVEFVDVAVVQVDNATGAVTFDRELPEDLEQHLLLDHVLPLVLANLGSCVVHGAVISRAGRSVVLVGSTGAGKSTLAAFAWLQGWDVGGDDGAVLFPTMPPTVEPTYATIRLTESAAGLLGIDRTRSSPIAGKVRVADAAGRRFRQERTELGLIAILEHAPEGAAAHFERLAGVAAHARLFVSTFHYDWSQDHRLDSVGDTVASIVESTLVGRLQVPRGLRGLDSAESLLRTILDESSRP